MTGQIDKASAFGGADPGRTGSGMVEPPTPPATSPVEYAVQALGDLLNLAFRDAVRLDQLTRKLVEAWKYFDLAQRITLSDAHPRLVEGLILLEDAIERIDRR